MANPNPDTSGLTPFPPGHSGNPGGMPKENITFFINKYLEMPIKEMLDLFNDEEKRNALPAKEAIALTQVARAIQGKDYPTDRVLDRTEGKAVETHIVFGAEKIDEIDRNVKRMLGVEEAKENEPNNGESSPAVE